MESITKHPAKICAACGVKLDTMEQKGQVFYVHFGRESQTHLPIPVDEDMTLQINSNCDFCHSTPVLFVVIATSLQMPAPHIASVSVGNFASCDTCAFLVGNKRWSQLVSRIRRNLPSAHLVPRILLENLYRELEKNIVRIEPVKPR